MWRGLCSDEGEEEDEVAIDLHWWARGFEGFERVGFFSSWNEAPAQFLNATWIWAEGCGPETDLNIWEGLGWFKNWAWAWVVIQNPGPIHFHNESETKSTIYLHSTTTLLKAKCMKHVHDFYPHLFCFITYLPLSFIYITLFILFILFILRNDG